MCFATLGRPAKETVLQTYLRLSAEGGHILPATPQEVRRRAAPREIRRRSNVLPVALARECDQPEGLACFAVEHLVAIHIALLAINMAIIHADAQERYLCTSRHSNTSWLVNI